jgi:hypothetical protein
MIYKKNDLYFKISKIIVNKMTTPQDISRDAIKEIKEHNEKIRKRNLSIVLYQEEILEQNCILKQNIYSENIRDLRSKIQKTQRIFIRNILDFLDDLDFNHNISYNGKIENLETADLIPFFISVLNR